MKRKNNKIGKVSLSVSVSVSLLSLFDVEEEESSSGPLRLLFHSLRRSLSFSSHLFSLLISFPPFLVTDARTLEEKEREKREKRELEREEESWRERESANQRRAREKRETESRRRANEREDRAILCILLFFLFSSVHQWNGILRCEGARG